MSFRSGVQQTVADSISLSGIGVHSGQPATLTIHPGDDDTGFIFLRTGIEGSQDIEIKADWSNVTATALCTVLGDPNGAFVSTVEHLLAALQAMGIDNALLEVDGPEVPIMDGSSRAFVDAIETVGVCQQSSKRKVLRILKPVRVQSGDAFGELCPHDDARFEMSIDYDHPMIGRQELALDLTPDGFRDTICRARTFGFLKDVEKLLAANFARGSSLDNAVVLTDDGVMNAEGVRWSDEFVRHKVLDAIGDLALLGFPIEGCYRSHKGGHTLNAAMMRALRDDPTSFEIVEVADATVSKPTYPVDQARQASEIRASEIRVSLEAATLRPETV
ncbi:MAG: UDP-3-O-acyl-N-acetylglucosamine deacetylase [Pseudomonadota bacterium]